VPAPHTSGGAVALEVAMAARRGGGLRRSRNGAVPSDRPRPRGGCTATVRLCVPGAGAGQPRPARPTLVAAVGVGAGVHSRRRAPGKGPRRSAACHDAAVAPRPRVRAGGSPGRPVRRPAHPRHAMTPEATAPERPPGLVSTGHRRPAPMDGPAPSRRSPAQVCS